MRARLTYLTLALGTIMLGLIVHFRGAWLGRVPRDVVGDVLWAAMIAWLVAAIAPHLSLGARSAVAIAICFAVELSQLYHAPFIDRLRQTTAGQLTLGSGFDVRDLFAYGIGVLLAALVDRWRRGARESGEQN